MSSDFTRTRNKKRAENASVRRSGAERNKGLRKNVYNDGQAPAGSDNDPRSMFPLRTTLALLLCTGCVALAARPPAGIAYWDLDHFHDTLPALFYDDSDYTPEGRLRWTTERYARKVRCAAAVIDSMALPVVALWSVENEEVVRDIAATVEGDYSYLHRTLNSLDGMDFALLYHGDRFFPHYVEPGRRYLYVEGLLRRGEGLRDTVGLLLCSDARMAEGLIADLRDEHPGVRLIVAGRAAPADPAAFGLSDGHARAERAGRGNIRARGGWRMRDRILADTAFRLRGGDVYLRRFLLDDATGYPSPTYDSRRYRGGCSYALPVFVYLE